MSEFNKLKDDAEQYGKDHPQQVHEAEQDAEHAAESKFGSGGGQDQKGQQDPGSQQGQSGQSSQQDQGSQQDQQDQGASGQGTTQGGQGQ
jgi:hypothetical protein